MEQEQIPVNTSAGDDFVVIKAINIDIFFNSNLFEIIKKNVIKNSNYINIEEKEEIVQKVLIRLYKSLKSKLKRYSGEGEPNVTMETRKFYSFVKRFCINEVIQWWRKNKKENNRRVIFHEDLDYSKPMSELLESLKYKGNNETDQINSIFCPKCSTAVYGDICPKCNHNIVPHILNVSNLRNGVVSEFKAQEDSLNLCIMEKQLKEFFTASEVKIIIMLAQNMTQKYIYEEIFKEKYKNPSIVHKKIKKIRRKIAESPKLRNYLKVNLE